jgi:hypothetical protein
VCVACFAQVAFQIALCIPQVFAGCAE